MRLVIVILLVVLLLLSLINRTEGFIESNMPFVSSFTNYRFDQNGKYLGCSSANPNNLYKTQFCLHRSCPLEYGGYDGICWLCINKNRVEDDFTPVVYSK